MSRPASFQVERRGCSTVRVIEYLTDTAYMAWDFHWRIATGGELELRFERKLQLQRKSRRHRNWDITDAWYTQPKPNQRDTFSHLYRGELPVVPKWVHMLVLKWIRDTMHVNYEVES